MAGLVPAIHVVHTVMTLDVDHRDKPGDDELLAGYGQCVSIRISNDINPNDR